MATQGERRADTRERLLAAAAELFAERGIEGASVDAIAERAGRTSGAVYDHFGGKQGLLFALLEGWTDDAAAAIGAEVAAATTLDERLEAIWRSFVAPRQGEDRWLLLEHELWACAARDEQARAHLARRYRAAWASLDESLRDWAREQAVEPPAPTSGAAIVGALVGLHMMRRIDPDAIDTETAVAVLRGAVGARPVGADR